MMTFTRYFLQISSEIYLHSTSVSKTAFERYPVDTGRQLNVH